MLNYNKIESCINFQRTPYRKLAEYMGLADSTLRSRLDKKNITPDDIEKIADFFEKPMLYFFDREEVLQKPYKNEEKLQVVNDPQPCSNCELLKEKIKYLEKINQLQDDKILLLERDVKKENGTSNRAQAG